MIYNNRNYPHPVLGVGTDFVKDNIGVELNVSSTGSNIEISPVFVLDNKELMDLITNNTACYISHVYCRGTLYREVFKSQTSLSEKISISAEKLNGEVEVDFFICANSKINNYSSGAFNSEYGNQKFSIDKGEIIAYAGKGKFFANKVPEELKAISSLMNIDCSNKSKVPMYLDYSGQKITIMLSIEDYSNYKLLKNNRQHLGVILSSLVLPSLIESFHYLEDDTSKDFKENAWYKSLSEFKNNPKYSGPFKAAQMILDNPLYKCFELLTIEE
jgi:hypothetical protein